MPVLSQGSDSSIGPSAGSGGNPFTPKEVELLRMLLKQQSSGFGIGSYQGGGSNFSGITSGVSAPTPQMPEPQQPTQQPQVQQPPQMPEPDRPQMPQPQTQSKPTAISDGGPGFERVDDPRMTGPFGGGFDPTKPPGFGGGSRGERPNRVSHNDVLKQLLSMPGFQQESARLY